MLMIAYTNSVCSRNILRYTRDKDFTIETLPSLKKRKITYPRFNKTISERLLLLLYKAATSCLSKERFNIKNWRRTVKIQ